MGIDDLAGDIGFLDGGGKFGGLMGGDLAMFLQMMYFIISFTTMPPVDLSSRIGDLQAAIGPGTALAGGFNPSAEYLTVPTPGSLQEFADGYYRQQIERAQSAAGIAGAAAKHLPGLQAALTHLKSVNDNPPGLAAIMQAGTEANIHVGATLADMGTQVGSLVDIEQDRVAREATGIKVAAEQAAGFYADAAGPLDMTPIPYEDPFSEE